MSQLITGNKRRRLRLGVKLKAGGEGEVWTLGSHRQWVLKLYKQKAGSPPASLLVAEAKIKAMLAQRPADPNRRHVSIAWPIDTVYEDGRFVGFVMPLVKQGADIIYNFAHPKERAKKYPLFTRRHAYHMASNLASAVNLIHHVGHVVGDMNPANILCRADGLVTFIDTDSFQVTSLAGEVFRCTVGVDDYLAPEIQGIRRGTFDWLPTHDRFALAIHVFELMCGVHPYAGVLKASGNPNRVNIHLMSRGIFPYVPNTEATPPPAAVARFDQLSIAMKAAFTRTFHDGVTNPRVRLTPAEWLQLLKAERDALVECPRCHAWNEPHLAVCPKCRANNPVVIGIQAVLTSLTAARRREADWRTNAAFVGAGFLVALPLTALWMGRGTVSRGAAHPSTPDQLELARSSKVTFPDIATPGATNFDSSPTRLGKSPERVVHTPPLDRSRRATDAAPTATPRPGNSAHVKLIIKLAADIYRDRWIMLNTLDTYNRQQAALQRHVKSVNSGAVPSASIPGLTDFSGDYKDKFDGKREASLAKIGEYRQLAELSPGEMLDDQDLPYLESNVPRSAILDVVREHLRLVGNGVTLSDSELVAVFDRLAQVEFNRRTPYAASR